jgi:predicted O-linked N-acetylglucosamine transferase (SPINDLY family)
MSDRDIKQTMDQAVRRHQAGDLGAAETLYAKVLEAAPRHPEALRLLGMLKQQRGDFAGAVELLERAVAERPREPTYLGNLALALGAARRPGEAVDRLRAALVLAPESEDIRFYLAQFLIETERGAEALEHLDRLVARRPENLELRFLRGMALEIAGRCRESVAELVQLLEARPDFAPAHNALGLALDGAGRFEESERAFDRARALDPSFHLPWLNLGSIRLRQDRLEEAEACLRRALDLRPGAPEALIYLAKVRFAQGRTAEGSDILETALRADPRNAKIHRHLALACTLRGDRAAAAERLRLALDLSPHDVRIREDLADALAGIGDLGGAAAEIRRALALRPDSFRLLAARDRLMRRRGLRAEDTGVPARAPSFDDIPDDELADAVSHRRGYCYWRGLDRDTARLERLLEREPGTAVHPFTALQVFTSAALQRVNAERFARAQHRGIEPLAPSAREPRDPPRALRLGYISADFREHPVTHLITEVLQLHDRHAVEVFAYSIGSQASGPARDRVIRAVDAFVDLAGSTDEAAARRIRVDAIDVLVDLSGYTAEARSAILARRPAPVQVNWLGFSGTLGAPFLDYIIADPVVAPRSADAFYTEKVVRLDHAYMPNDRARRVGAAPSRGELGLPADAIVLCSFNAAYKFTPELFALWAETARRIPRAVLWLRDVPAVAAANLRGEWAEAGLTPDRLIFASTVPSAEDHLARYRQADLALDTYPYGSHSTAMDALWAGCPVVTLQGETFASRVAASLLHAVGLPQLVARNVDEYRQLVLRLATRPDELAAMRATLDAGRDRAPLFDTPSFARRLEAAYRRMWEIHASGRAPESFDIG